MGEVVGFPKVHLVENYQSAVDQLIDLAEQVEEPGGWGFSILLNLLCYAAAEECDGFAVLSALDKARDFVIAQMPPASGDPAA